MIELHSFTAFLIAAFILLITPGPAVLYIVTRSVDQGKRAGFVAILGLAIGNLFHVAAAAFGLSALLVTSTTAFHLVKYAGAAYLIYLGIRKCIQREEASNQKQMNKSSLSAAFRQSIFVNLLNPKPALFFFAFLPQFVDPVSALAPQILYLGLTFIILGIFTDSLYALISGAIASRVQQSRFFLQSGRYLAGSVYLALGVYTALSSPPKSTSR